MDDSIGVLLPEDTQRPPCGRFYCAGHSDASSLRAHSTAWEYFGRFGVAATQNGENPSVVSLVEIEHPQADYTVDEARQFALQILQAADVAERANLPLSPVARVTSLLSAAMRAATH